MIRLVSEKSSRQLGVFILSQHRSTIKSVSHFSPVSTLINSNLKNIRKFSLTTPIHRQRFNVNRNSNGSSRILGKYTDVARVATGLFGVASILTFVSAPVIILSLPLILIGRSVFKAWFKRVDRKRRVEIAASSKLKIPTMQNDSQILAYTERILKSLFENNDNDMSHKLGVQQDSNEIPSIVCTLEGKESRLSNESASQKGSGYEYVTANFISTVNMGLYKKRSGERIANITLTVIGADSLWARSEYNGTINAYLEITPNGFFSKTIQVSELSDGFDGVNEVTKNAPEEIVIQKSEFKTTANDD